MDVTLTSATADGRLTGTGFTKTTTTVFVDDASVPFAFVSDTELQVDPLTAGSTVSVEKGGVTSDEVKVGADDPDQQGAPQGHTAQNPDPVELGTYQGGHLPGANVNEAVHQTAVERVEEDLGIGVRDPYPTGNPPDPEDAFQQQHGYRRGEDPLAKQQQLSGKTPGEK